MGGFELGQLTVLSDLSFPKLTTVTVMNFTALPALQQLAFGDNGITQADSILITNTGLSSLQGINNLQTISTFNVNNNAALQNISLQVTSIKNSLDIEANDGYISGLTTSFPMLQTAQNMTFRNCSSVSLPSLANVTDDLGFYGNTMESFMAPNLTTVGGLIFVDNTALTNISIPGLVSVNGSYQIANNTMLKKINGFTKLSVIKGALDFNGNFSEYDFSSSPDRLHQTNVRQCPTPRPDPGSRCFQHAKLWQPGLLSLRYRQQEQASYQGEIHLQGQCRQAGRARHPAIGHQRRFPALELQCGRPRRDQPPSHHGGYFHPRRAPSPPSIGLGFSMMLTSGALRHLIWLVSPLHSYFPDGLLGFEYGSERTTV